jgi:hypothetical protein
MSVESMLPETLTVIGCYSDNRMVEPAVLSQRFEDFLDQFVQVTNSGGVKTLRIPRLAGKWVVKRLDTLHLRPVCPLPDPCRVHNSEPIWFRNLVKG